MDRERFLPTIICLQKSGGAAGWIERDDVEIVELKKRPGNDWRIIGKLAGALRERQIDVVHSHNWGTLLETTLARKRARTPVHIHAERGTVLGRVQGSGIRFRLRAMAMRWALNRVDTVMSNAVSVAGRVEEACGYSAELIHIIPNGVERPPVENEAKARQQIREEFGIPQSAFVAGSVGRLHAVKGFDIAVQAIDELRRGDREIHLLLVGDGPEEEKLRELVQSLDLNGLVHFAGRRDDIGRWLAAMDIFINTSHSEGMSQSLVEAMAAGLPLVVTDVGDSRLLAGEGEQSCGIVVPPNDAAALARAVMRLSEAPPSINDLARTAQFRHDKRFSVQRMADGFESLYLRLRPSADASVNRHVSQRRAVR